MRYLLTYRPEKNGITKSKTLKCNNDTIAKRKARQFADVQSLVRLDDNVELFNSCKAHLKNNL